MMARRRLPRLPESTPVTSKCIMPAVFGAVALLMAATVACAESGQPPHALDAAAISRMAATVQCLRQSMAVRAAVEHKRAGMSEAQAVTELTAARQYEGVDLPTVVKALYESAEAPETFRDNYQRRCSLIALRQVMHDACVKRAPPADREGCARAVEESSRPLRAAPPFEAPASAP